MLTAGQIQQLFAFCASKQVQYYDVQVELVDHLANAIELRMQEDPGLSFEKALELTYQDFGIFGFSKIVSAKELSVMERQRHFFYTTVKGHFKWPKLVLLLLLMLTMNTAVTLFGLAGIYTIMVSVFFSSVIVIFYVSTRLSSIRRRLNKKLVIATFMYRSGWLHFPLYIQIFSNKFLQDSTWIVVSSNEIYRLLFALFFAIYIILILAHFQTFRSVEDSVKKGFPELISE
jgi:hypothetical protein